MDKLTISEQPSTSRNVSFDVAAVKSSGATPTMFSGTFESHLYGTSSVPIGYRSLARIDSGVASAP